MNKRRISIGIAALALVAAAAWGFGFLGGTDPALAELEQMRDKMFDDDLPEADRGQLRDDFRQRIRSLSDDQRHAFFEGSRGQWMQHAGRRMDEFFALPAADQQKRLDEILNRMLERQRNPGAGNQRGNGGRGRGNWGNRTEAQRDERAKRRLDQTTPRMRAQFTEFRRRLNDRAEQRGIDISNLPGRPGGGWRGRA